MGEFDKARKRLVLLSKNENEVEKAQVQVKPYTRRGRPVVGYAQQRKEGAVKETPPQMEETLTPEQAESKRKYEEQRKETYKKKGWEGKEQPGKLTEEELARHFGSEAKIPANFKETHKVGSVIIIPKTGQKARIVAIGESGFTARDAQNKRYQVKWANLKAYGEEITPEDKGYLQEAGYSNEQIGQMKKIDPQAAELGKQDYYASVFPVQPGSVPEKFKEKKMEEVEKAQVQIKPHMRGGKPVKGYQQARKEAPPGYEFAEEPKKETAGDLTEEEIGKLKEMKGTADELEFLKKYPEVGRSVIRMGEEKGFDLGRKVSEKVAEKTGAKPVAKEAPGEYVATEEQAKEKPKATKKPEGKPAEVSIPEGKAGEPAKKVLEKVKEAEKKPSPKEEKATAKEAAMKEFKEKGGALPAKGAKLKEPSKAAGKPKLEDIEKDPEHLTYVRTHIKALFQWSKRADELKAQMEAALEGKEAEAALLRPDFAKYDNLEKEEGKFRTMFEDEGNLTELLSFLKQTVKYHEVLKNLLPKLPQELQNTVHDLEKQFTSITVQERWKQTQIQKAFEGLLDMLEKAGKIPPKPKKDRIAPAGKPGVSAGQRPATNDSGDDGRNQKPTLSHRKTVHEFFGDDKATPDVKSDATDHPDDNKANMLMKPSSPQQGSPAPTLQGNGPENGEGDPTQQLVQTFKKLVGLKERVVMLYRELAEAVNSNGKQTPEAEEKTAKALHGIWMDLLKARFVDLVKAATRVRGHTMRTKHGMAWRKEHQRMTPGQIARVEQRKGELAQVHEGIRRGEVYLDTAFGRYRVSGYNDETGWAMTHPEGKAPDTWNQRSFMVGLEDFKFDEKPLVTEEPALHYGATKPQWEAIKDVLRTKVKAGEITTARQIQQEREKLQELKPEELSAMKQGFAILPEEQEQARAKMAEAQTEEEAKQVVTEWGTALMAKEVEPEYGQTVATTVLQQMGGMGRIHAMTGAKNFVRGMDNGKPWVSFEFPNRGRSKPNYVKVILEPDDTYTVEFGRKKPISWKGAAVAKEEGRQPTMEDFYTKLSEHPDIYAEDLKGLFENETGLYLSFQAGEPKEPYGGRGLKKADPDSYKRPHWYKDPGTEEEEGIAARRAEEKKGEHKQTWPVKTKTGKLITAHRKKPLPIKSRKTMADMPGQKELATPKALRLWDESYLEKVQKGQEQWPEEQKSMEVLYNKELNLHLFKNKGGEYRITEGVPWTGSIFSQAIQNSMALTENEYKALKEDLLGGLVKLMGVEKVKSWPRIQRLASHAKMYENLPAIIDSKAETKISEKKKLKKSVKGFFNWAQRKDDRKEPPPLENKNSDEPENDGKKRIAKSEAEFGRKGSEATTTSKDFGSDKRQDTKKKKGDSPGKAALSVDPNASGQM